MRKWLMTVLFMCAFVALLSLLIHGASYSMNTIKQRIVHDHNDKIKQRIEYGLDVTISEHSGYALNDTVKQHTAYDLNDTIKEHGLGVTISENNGYSLNDTAKQRIGYDINDTIKQHIGSGLQLQDILKETVPPKKPMIYALNDTVKQRIGYDLNDTIKEIIGSGLKLQDMLKETVPPKKPMISQRDQRKTLLFHLHLRKAGGSTVKKMLLTQILKTHQSDGERNLRSKSITGGAAAKAYVDNGGKCVFPALDEFLEMDSLSSLDMLSGQFKWGIDAYIPSDIDLFYITTLRNPSERVVSEYFYEQFQSQVENTPHVFKSFKKKWTLERYVEEALVSPSRYVQWLCGCTCEPPFSREHVELAKDHLRQVDILGLTEDMPDFVERLSDAVWFVEVDPSEFAACTENCTPKYETPPGVLERLNQGLQQDWEIYNLAVTLVEQQKREFAGVSAPPPPAV